VKSATAKTAHPFYTMSSTASRPTEANPATPTFSYAQAAKGRAASSTTSAIQSSQATSGVATPAKESVPATDNPSALVNGAAGSDSGERILNGNHDVVSKADPLGVGISMEAKSNPLTNSGSLSDSPSFGTASTSTLPKEDEVTLTANGVEGSWRNRESISGTEKTPETEGRRGKKGKKPRNTEKEPEKEKEEVKPEILVAAPPPAVNIWQQRREAQAAKAKPTPSVPQSSQVFDPTSTNDAASGQSSKPAELKRRGKAEGDKPQGAAQNGSHIDVSGSVKGQKKSSEATNKAKDEPTKRAGPRGSRGNEKDDKAQQNQLPPPVEDAVSWPTPETALEEEKRKAQEKPEKEVKDESASNKSRPKEKWMPVPFVPSVNFATPIPARGGRGRGGGRGGRDSNGRGSHASNGGAGQEKATQTSTSTLTATGDLETRGRGNSNGGRAASLPPNSSKTSPTDTRGDRKSVASSSVEKSKPQSSTSTKGESGPAMTSQIEPPVESHQNQQGLRGDNSKKAEQIQGSSNEHNAKPGTADRRESIVRGSDQIKDGGSFSKDIGQARERVDGRSDRGRGGFRGGRGNHNYPNTQNPQQAFANGQAAQPANGFPPRNNSNPYSSPIQQTPFTNQFVPNSSRGGRGGSRSQSIPNTAIFPRFPGQQMQPLQSNQSMFDYQTMQSMSATPYNPFNMESYSVLAMVTMQLEYYFSIDNLCKDVFLRKHMDSQGFVFLAFIANFKRIQALTQDFELLRYACQESRIIDIIQGEDGVDRLRRNEGWEKWVLAMEERDESVRHAGPKYHHRQQPRSQMGQMVLSGNQAMSAPPFSPNGMDSSFPPYPNEASLAPTMNGNGHHPETSLSAAVPDFAPGISPLNGLTESLEEETFNNEEVAALMIVVTSSKSSAPFHSSSSRTFSNGSIDGNPLADESHDSLRQGRTLTNGSRGSET
jgi:la-related protein 1